MIDVIIADDQELFHIGMKDVLADADDVRVLGQPHSPEQLLNTLEEFNPHVLLLSTNFLPVFSKIQPILEQRQTALLVLAEEDDPAAYVPKLGARGIVYRSMNGPALVEAMRRVARGEVFIQSRSSDLREERLLYVCYDPTALVSRERLLLSMGYQVCTVLGRDGLMARMEVDYFDFALIGDEGPLAERQAAVSLLKESYPKTPVIALCRDAEKIEGTDYHVSSADADIWPDPRATRFLR
jgi:DNA-binding NarL/FixJ family response regulator